MNRLLATMIILTLMAGTLPADASAPDQVWIAYGPEPASELGLALERLDIPVRVLPNLDMAIFVAPPIVAQQLRGEGWTVFADHQEEMHLDRSVPYLGADRVKQALGSQRNGPTVVVIDTGVDSNHPDFTDANLAANVQAKRSSNGLVQGIMTDSPVMDLSGHGSHVAGIVAGLGQALGAQDPRNGEYVGVYSNGRIASFQASTVNEDPEQIAVDVSLALEGFEWALDNQDTYDIRVITNSWGSPGDIVPEHPVAQASLRAYAAGMTVFFSAGNEGEEGTLNRHCLPPWVMCVAAGTLDDARASFSSMGNTPSKSYGAYDHPDVTAPGSQIRSADPPVASSPTALLTSSGSEALYTDRSGTSMAAPHAAGVAALLQAANAKLSPDQIMDILVETARPMAGDVHEVGAGYVDAIEGYNLAISTLGERDAFLAGEKVKYGGASTGDDAFGDDPVTVGYDSESGGNIDRSFLVRPAPPAWLLDSYAPWIMAGLGLLFILAGIRWRARIRRAPDATAAEPY